MRVKLYFLFLLRNEKVGDVSYVFFMVDYSLIVILLYLQINFISRFKTSEILS